MTTITTTETRITPEALTAFRLRLKGEVILPGDETYESAREVHNATIDRRPVIIVRVADAADVSRAVNFARKTGLPLTVRSGGHSIPGHSVVEGGVVIDMGAMDEIRIEPDQRVAWVQPGATTGAFSEEAAKYGLAVPFGDAGSVGVGGITLGGGIGFLARKHGLTVDHVLGIELVTADGQIVHATETDHPDLFWALRGGGGNFGVVTGFQFRLAEVGTVLGGLVILPATEDVIRRYVDIAADAPEELTTISMVMRVPPLPFVPADRVGELGIGIFLVYSGDPEEGQKAVAPLRALAAPIADVVMPMPYPAIYQFMEEASQRRRTKVRSAFMPAITDNFITSVLDHLAAAPAPMAFVQIRPLGGQMARVAPEATAFSHRAANFMVSVINVWDEAAADGMNFAWVDGIWDSVKQYGAGVYSNFLMDEGEQRIREAYLAGTYERLAEIKAAYDPENIFHRTQNIQPRRLTAAA